MFTYHSLSWWDLKNDTFLSEEVIPKDRFQELQDILNFKEEYVLKEEDGPIVQSFVFHKMDFKRHQYELETTQI